MAREVSRSAWESTQYSRDRSVAGERPVDAVDGREHPVIPSSMTSATTTGTKRTRAHLAARIPWILPMRRFSLPGRSAGACQIRNLAWIRAPTG